MPKKIKTKKQKIRADLKRTHSSTISYKADIAVYSIPTTNSHEFEEKLTETISITDKSLNNQSAVYKYPYLKTDLQKTIILTASIALIQIAVKILF